MAACRGAGVGVRAIAAMAPDDRTPTHGSGRVLADRLLGLRYLAADGQSAAAYGS